VTYFDAVSDDLHFSLAWRFIALAFVSFFPPMDMLVPDEKNCERDPRAEARKNPSGLATVAGSVS
jgi:hypothetical protein